MTLLRCIYLTINRLLQNLGQWWRSSDERTRLSPARFFDHPHWPRSWSRLNNWKLLPERPGQTWTLGLACFPKNLHTKFLCRHEKCQSFSFIDRCPPKVLISAQWGSCEVNFQPNLGTFQQLPQRVRNNFKKCHLRKARCLSFYR